MKVSPLSRNNAQHLRIANILVPIDFSARSITAIPAAKRLAQRFGAMVHLAHVQDYSYPAVLIGPPAPVLIAPMRDFEEWKKLAEDRLRSVAKEYRLAGTSRVEIAGAPFDMLCSIANQIPADVIVTSTHGRTGFRRAFLGSTAERLVQHSPCPVLVARENQTKGASAHRIDTILVPVDFSDCSLGGLNYAIQFAKKFAAKILVLHMLDLGPLLTADGYAIHDLSASRQAIVREAEERMRKFVRRARFDGVPFETAIRTGASVSGICKVAHSKKVDLIITATHGQTGLKHLLIGSTAEVVVRSAPCSVLVVPSHPEVRGSNLTRRAASIQRITKPAFARAPRKQFRRPWPHDARGKLSRKRLQNGARRTSFASRTQL